MGVTLLRCQAYHTAGYRSVVRVHQQAALVSSELLLTREVTAVGDHSFQVDR